MLLQHDNAKPHTSAVTSAVRESIGFEVVPHPPYSLDLAPSDFWLFAALKKPLRGIQSHVMKNFKLLQENFENSLQSYIALGLKNLFKAGGVKLNKRETTLKNEVQKQSTHSELYLFCILFHFDNLSGSKHTLRRHYFPNTLCASPFGDAGNKLTSKHKVSHEQLIVISGGEEMSSFH
jgi:hypothetical protein